MSETTLQSIKLNLGCGNTVMEGYKGVDIAKTEAADIVADINKPWKFAKDNSVDEIFASHVLEHIDIMHVMNEACRVLKPAGLMTVIVPYYSSVRATQDPTHINFLSENSFLYYNKKWRDDNGLSHYPITADFDFGYAHQWDQEWVSRSDDAKRFALKFYQNVVSDLHVTLTKRG